MSRPTLGTKKKWGSFIANTITAIRNSISTKIDIVDILESAGNDNSEYLTETTIVNSNEQFVRGDLAMTIQSGEIANIYQNRLGENNNNPSLLKSQWLALKGSTAGDLLDYYSGIAIELIAPNTTRVVSNNRIYQALRSDSGTNAPTGTLVSNIYWQYIGDAGGHIIQDEGVPLTQRPNLNFVGLGVQATDNPGNNSTDVTIGLPQSGVYTLVMDSTTGSPATNYTTHTTPVLTTPTGSELFLFTPIITNTSNSTLTITGSPTLTKSLQNIGTSGLQNIPANTLIVGTTYVVIYNSTSDVYQVTGIYNNNIQFLGNIYYIGVNGSNFFGVKGDINKPFASLTYVNTLITSGDTIVFLPGVTDNTSTVTISHNVFIYICTNVYIITPIVLSIQCLISGESRYYSNIYNIDVQGTNVTSIQNCNIISFKMWTGHTAKCVGCSIEAVSRSSGSGVGILTLLDCELTTTTSDVTIAYNAKNVTINHSGSDLFLCNGNTSASFDDSRATVTGGFNIRMGEGGIFETNNSVFKANQISLKKIPSVSSPQQMLFQGCKVVSSSGTYAFISDGSTSGNAAFILLMFYNGSANKTFDPTAGTGIPAGDISSSVINALVF